MTRRSKTVFGGLFLLVLLAAGCALALMVFANTPVGPPRQVVHVVAPGDSLSNVAQSLEGKGVVSNALGLKLLARLRGAGRAIQAGEYEFSKPATPGQVLDRLVAGDVRRYRFTVPEGLTRREIAARLEGEGLGDAGRFLQLTADPELIGELGIEAPTLEGYLFPETYTLEAGFGEKRLVRRMVTEFRRHLTENLEAAAREQGLNVHELVTLASIVQKEAGNVEEMPLIAAVFHNRLQRGMPLQADPTVIYGIADFDGNLTREHLRTPTPYNTYRKRGLPAGPIANPGEEALRAAAAPADAPYLYFVAKGDGSHVFNRSLQEHNRAVRRYQLGR